MADYSNTVAELNETNNTIAEPIQQGSSNQSTLLSDFNPGEFGPHSSKLQSIQPASVNIMAAPVLSILPAWAEHKVGDSIPFTVYLDTAGQMVRGMQLAIDYDPAVLQLLNNQIAVPNNSDSPFDILSLTVEQAGRINIILSSPNHESSQYIGNIIKFTLKAVASCSASPVSLNPEDTELSPQLASITFNHATLAISDTSSKQASIQLIPESAVVNSGGDLPISVQLDTGNQPIRGARIVLEWNPYEFTFVNGEHGAVQSSNSPFAIQEQLVQDGRLELTILEPSLQEIIYSGPILDFTLQSLTESAQAEIRFNSNETILSPMTESLAFHNAQCEIKGGSIGRKANLSIYPASMSMLSYTPVSFTLDLDTEGHLCKAGLIVLEYDPAVFSFDLDANSIIATPSSPFVLDSIEAPQPGQLKITILERNNEETAYTGPILDLTLNVLQPAQSTEIHINNSQCSFSPTFDEIVTSDAIIDILTGKQEDWRIVSDSSWKCWDEDVNNWEEIDFDDSSWRTVDSPHEYSMSPQSIQWMKSTTAKWIWDSHSEQDGSDETIYFRKTFELTTTPVQAVLAITADDRYDVYINGERVERDESDSEDAELYSAARYLRKGENVIAVEVRDYGEQEGLLADLRIAFDPIGNPVKRYQSAESFLRLLTNSSVLDFNELTSDTELEQYEYSGAVIRALNEIYGGTVEDDYPSNTLFPNTDDGDIFITFQIPVYGAGLAIVDRDDEVEYGAILFFDKNDEVIGMTDMPRTGNAESVFIGLLSNQPIAKIFVQENADSDEVSYDNLIFGIPNEISDRPETSLPTGLWEFNDPNALMRATIGQDLLLIGDHQVVSGINEADLAARIGYDSHYLCFHGMEPNGGSEDKVNQYTFLFDFKVDDLDDWHCFYQANGRNDNDGEVFIDREGEIGEGSTGYSDPLVEVDTWYRFGVVVDLLAESVEYYLDGRIIHRGSESYDGRFAPWAVFRNYYWFLLFGDNNGEDSPIHISNIALFDSPLTSSEITVLGKAGDPVPGSDSVSPTPTSTPTPTVTNIPIPTQTPLPTYPPNESATPDVIYEFDQQTIKQNGWLEIPGGFGSTEPGTLMTDISFSDDLIPSSNDQKGLSIIVNDNEVTFILSEKAIDTKGYPVLLRIVLRSDYPNAQISVGALKGDLLQDINVDGSINVTTVMTAESFIYQEGYILALYQPDYGKIVNPFIQVAGTTGNPVTIWIDRMKIFILSPGSPFPTSQ